MLQDMMTELAVGQMPSRGIKAIESLVRDYSRLCAVSAYALRRLIAIGDWEGVQVLCDIIDPEEQA